MPKLLSRLPTLRFFRDAAGDPRARLAKSWGPIAHFLESDLQGSADHAREILQAIDRLERGEIGSWEETGNVHTLVLSPQKAEIHSEIDTAAPPFHLSLSQLRRILDGWIEFLKK
jgi:hypothetical protein